MSPRPKLEHLRKPQIVAAAAEVLYERGLFDTRIGDIAERAGTSSATILYYFESKDQLLEEAVEARRPGVVRAPVRGPRALRAAPRAKLARLIEDTCRGPGPAGRLARSGWRSGCARCATRRCARSYLAP